MDGKGEITFARKASGLVRGLSLMDAFGVGFMNQGLTPSIWVMVSLGLSVYMGGNLIIATILSVVLAGIGFPLVWGILGGSMPRSGGEYIYNSRIIHPLIGIGESFGNAFIWLMWIYVLAPWMADPGAKMLAEFEGWTWLYNGTTDTFLGGLSPAWGSFVIASIANVIAVLFVVFGVKVFARVQKVVMGLGLIGAIAIIVALFMYSKQHFVDSWNGMATQYGSLSYNDFVKAASDSAGTAMPTTWNWYDTFGVMVAGSWLFAYSYCITFIAGEVKRPDKSIILGNLFAIIVPAVFMILTAIGLYRLVDFNFLSASAYTDQLIQDGGSLAGYAMPWSPHFVGLAAVVMHNKVMLFLMALSFLLFDLWWVALSYLAFPRIIFAWGMDRMGPKWFTDVNARFASPIKNYILGFCIAEGLIALYVFWQNDAMQGLSVTALEIFSVFGVTAIAAAIFPFSPRAKGIWQSSPYRRWQIFHIPVVTLGAVVNLAYLAILAVFFFFQSGRNLEGFTLTTGVLILATWALGLCWYWFWSWRAKRTAGISTGMLTGELPPE